MPGAEANASEEVQELRRRIEEAVGRSVRAQVTINVCL